MLFDKPYVMVSTPAPVQQPPPTRVTRSTLEAYLHVPTAGGAYTYVPQLPATPTLAPPTPSHVSRKRTHDEDAAPRKKQKRVLEERDATLESGEQIHVSTVHCPHAKEHSIRMVTVTGK